MSRTMAWLLSAAILLAVEALGWVAVTGHDEPLPEFGRTDSAGSPSPRMQEVAAPLVELGKKVETCAARESGPPVVDPIGTAVEFQVDERLTTEAVARWIESTGSRLILLAHQLDEAGATRITDAVLPRVDAWAPTRRAVTSFEVHDFLRMHDASVHLWIRLSWQRSATLRGLVRTGLPATHSMYLVLSRRVSMTLERARLALARPDEPAAIRLEPGVGNDVVARVVARPGTVVPVPASAGQR